MSDRLGCFDSLGDRMKGYERAARISLPRRMPVIIRVDGKAFHTLTRGCEKPFDDRLMRSMDCTALCLCEQIQGAQIAYVQSDEISLLLHNYKRYASEAWFDNQSQKMVSVAASIATESFNAAFHAAAHFDARVFVLPEAEVCNYFIWRQQDATRNSIQMLARSLYSHRECEYKSMSVLQEMCFAKGHNWNDLSVAKRRGRCVVRQETLSASETERWAWRVDGAPPIFTYDRNYIEQHLAVLPEDTADDRGDGRAR